jgi:hypothetical protein
MNNQRNKQKLKHIIRITYTYLIQKIRVRNHCVRRLLQVVGHVEVVLNLLQRRHGLLLRVLALLVQELRQSKVRTCICVIRLKSYKCEIE